MTPTSPTPSSHHPHPGLVAGVPSRGPAGAEAPGRARWPGTAVRCPPLSPLPACGGGAGGEGLWISRVQRTDTALVDRIDKIYKMLFIFHLVNPVKKISELVRVAAGTMIKAVETRRGDLAVERAVPDNAKDWNDALRAASRVTLAIR